MTMLLRGWLQIRPGGEDPDSWLLVTSVPAPDTCDGRRRAGREAYRRIQEYLDRHPFPAFRVMIITGVEGAHPASRFDPSEYDWQRSLLPSAN
jgi:hypothetical protein